MKNKLVYETLERIEIAKPVDRLAYISSACKGFDVIDIGCYDETALVKRDSDAWLHERIFLMAKSVIGIDSSELIPENGIQTSLTSRIIRGDATRLDSFKSSSVDVIVAGEFIEHIIDPISFFRHVIECFPGRILLISTPNGMCFANTLLGLIRREAQHPDHLHVFTYKILNTLCIRAGFKDYKIIPYRFYATEMILRSSGIKRFMAQAAEQFIRLIERFFPLLGFGYILEVKL